jgi:hypothetical protein
VEQIILSIWLVTMVAVYSVSESIGIAALQFLNPKNNNSNILLAKLFYVMTVPDEGYY